MAAKYFVWGEGVWREVDVATGRVSGWRGRANFVFLRRGKLEVARRRPVLRALAALAAGQAGAAADGRRLAHRSKSESSARQRRERPAPPALPAPLCEHHHCCAQCAHSGCSERARPAPPAPPGPTPGVALREAATQCVSDAASGPARAHAPSDKLEPARAQAPGDKPEPAHAATSLTVVESDSSSADEFVKTRVPPPAATGDKARGNDVSALLGKVAPTGANERPRGRRRARTRARPADLSERTYSSDDEPLAQRVAAGTYRSAAAVCKELVVSEADIAALRGFVARTRPTALARFDADDAYKRALFYAINPLVEVERCAQLERLLASRSAAALPHFAARLGLAPRADRSPPPSPARRTRLSSRRPRAPSASSDTDKENKDKQNKVRSEPIVLADTKQSPGTRARPAPRPAVQGDKRQKVAPVKKAPLTNGVVINAPTAKRPAAAPAPARRKAVLESEDSGVEPSVSDVKIPSAPRHVISKRASRANAKEYSNLEDHAIVAWVSAGARASLVGGNRVWRELQEQYPRLTGRERSWHSLRNRYLRYILPALGALHLPPADVSRLRAAASTGAIKRHNRPSRPLAAPRHPMFKEPERGASSRRPRPPPTPRAARPASSAPDIVSDDSDGPVAPRRRSLRARPLDSSSKDDSSKDSPSKASGSKETSNKDESGKEATSKATRSKQLAGKAAASRAPPKARSPRYSEVTRRFAERHRPPAAASSSSPVTSRSPSPVLTPSRSRRLFNPNANV